MRARQPAARPPADAAHKTALEQAGDARAARLRVLEASGPSDEPWTREAAAVFGRSKASAGARARVAAPRCFRDGCIVTVTYPNHAAFEAFDRTIPSSDRFAAWPAPKYRTPGVTRDDGTVTADWILFRPVHQQGGQPDAQ